MGGTCFHKCVKDSEFHKKAKLQFFDNDQRLLETYEKATEGDEESIEIIMDFLFEKNGRTKLIIIPIEQIRSYR